MHSNYNLLTLSDSRLLNSNGQTIYYKERIEGRNMKITDTIKYVGVNDHQVDLFEGQYAVPNGMAYNSYVILDDKVAVMDTVDANFKHEWLDNLEQALGGRKPDYLIVQHMEPDHAANVANFLEVYPGTTVVANAKTFVMIKNFFGLDLEGQKLEVENGSTLSLGNHNLTFVFAPMVHWPEVMVTYDSTDKVLFSADGFGKFGALSLTENEDWACEARRYYFNIVGKYGAPVQTLLKKASALDIKTICPLHGPVLSDNLGYYLDLYNTWSSYQPESKGIFIAYASIHGNTAVAANRFADMLRDKGVEKVVVTDLSRCDIAEAVEDAFRYDRMVVASPTYDGGIFTPVLEFLQHINSKMYQNRKVGIIENGSWAPMAGKKIKEFLTGMKNIEIVEPTVTVKSAMKQNTIKELESLADSLL